MIANWLSFSARGRFESAGIHAGYVLSPGPELRGPAPALPGTGDRAGVAAGVEGWCWTQLADVEQEVNGLLTADRRPKLDVARIAAVFAALDARRSA